MPCGVAALFIFLLFIACCAFLLLFAFSSGNAFRNPSATLGFRPGVGILEVSDEILDEQLILEDLDELRDMPGVKAIVVRVNSPGGSIAAVEEIYDALMKVRGEGVPVVASMGDTAASGGYLISLAGERIFASQGTLTGSIGVIIEYSSAQQLFDKIGVKLETVSTGELKETGSMGHPLTELQRNSIQQVVDDYHAQFMELVQKSRKMDEARVRALADGRVFTGRQAKAEGLIDEIGGLDAAVAYAGQVAGIEGKPRMIRLEDEPYSLFDVMRQLRTEASTRLRAQAWAPKFILR